MKRVFFVWLLSLTVLLTGFPAMAEEPLGPKVVVSIKPVHSLVTGVMRGVAQPALLMKGASSPHGYVLRPSEARLLAQADLVIWVGPNLETFLKKPLANIAVNSLHLELTGKMNNLLLPLRESGRWESHASLDGDHSHEVHEAHHDQVENMNPHIWLNPLLATEIVRETAEALIQIDPDHALTYRENSKRLIRRLEGFDQVLRNKLSGVKKVPYIVFHDAYHYFEKAYDLNAVGSVTVSPDRLPGARRLTEIRKKIAESNARCVFMEPQFEPRLVETIVAGTDAKTAILDPVGIDLPEGEESYFLLLENLADSLIAGLQ
jgi:zinc transport system substrate-binding protein